MPKGASASTPFLPLSLLRVPLLSRHLRPCAARICRTQSSSRPPIPLTNEADEYLLALAATLADLVILKESLTHSRTRSANLFMVPSAFASGKRCKASAISAAAAFELRRTPAVVPPDAAAAVLELADAEAAQLQLEFDGGVPWESFRAEPALYRIQQPSASWNSRTFRAVSMIPALLLLPRWFYTGRRWRGSQFWYKRSRRDFLPLPQMTNARTPPSSRNTPKG
jgi:hypothetical protein